MRGYGKTIEAFKNRENSSKPFKPSPDFEDRPIRHINAAHERIQPTSKIIGIITGKLEPFEETQEGITIPVFPEQLSWATNWNSNFGMKITTPPTASKKVTFNPVISPKIKRDFSANSRIKVNPIGVVNFDTKWHPVSSDSTLTSKLVYSEPYILDEGSDKTLGGFIGRDKSSDDSVAKLLVKDPYHELKKESVFTDRIDQFVPPSYGDISYPTEEVEEPYQAAHEYHRQPVYEPVQPVYESRQPVYESRQPVYEPVFREDYEPRKS